MAIDKAIRCNGPRLNAPQFEAELTTWFLQVIREVRSRFVLGDDQLAGVRFKSDEIVLLSVRSNATQQQVIEAPLSWAHAALEDCASRDHHYAVEKEYDVPWACLEKPFEDEEFGGEG